MGIEFNCSHCSRLVKAPDTMAGKKARCPQCQQVVQVPEPVFEAEEIPAAAPAPEAFSQPDPFQFQQPDVAAQQPAAFGEESRQPCPMCGEMIVANALKCRYCGEVFDASLKPASPKMREDFRRQMNGVGGLWIFFGVMSLLVGLAVAAIPRAEGPIVLVLFVVFVACCWLTFGICTCLKQIWAVYAGLVLSYLTLLLNVLTALGGIAQGGAGGGACGGIFGIVLIIAGIVQAHRCLGLHRQIVR